jgi:hypothetical protein
MRDFDVDVGFLPFFGGVGTPRHPSICGGRVVTQPAFELGCWISGHVV